MMDVFICFHSSHTGAKWMAVCVVQCRITLLGLHLVFAAYKKFRVKYDF